MHEDSVIILFTAVWMVHVSCSPTWDAPWYVQDDGQCLDHVMYCRILYDA